MPSPEAIGTVLGTVIIIVFGFFVQDKRLKRSEEDSEALARATAEKVAERKHDENVSYWETKAREQFESFQRQIDDFKQREHNLNERLTAKYNTLTALEHRVSEMEDERKAAEQKVSDLERAAAERAEAYNHRITELEGELHTLRRRVEDLVAENERLQTERDRVQTREQELQAKVAHQEHEIADLQRRIIVLEAEKDVLERLLDRLEVVRVQVNEATAGATPDMTAQSNSEDKGEWAS